jgi:hypothetical protein
MTAGRKKRNIQESHFHLEVLVSKTNMILMIVCSLIAIGVVSAIFLFGLPVKNVVFGLMILICPLSHLLMMNFMGHGHDGDHHTKGQPNEIPGNTGNR